MENDIYLNQSWWKTLFEEKFHRSKKKFNNERYRVVLLNLKKRKNVWLIEATIECKCNSR